MPVKSCEVSEETQQFQAEVQRHLRRNMAANLLDGALFWFGINFFAAGTIVPLYVRHLTKSRLLIGLVATIAGSGWYLPQLLTANYLQRVPRKKPVVIQIGLFAERLPLLAAALSAFLLAERSPRLALVTFFACLAWFNVGAGLIAVAWQEMFAKVIPVQYREGSSAWPTLSEPPRECLAQGWPHRCWRDSLSRSTLASASRSLSSSFCSHGPRWP